MKHYIFAGPAAVLAAGALIASAPQVNAGCQYGGIAVIRCDGPIQPHGTWQRCVLFNSVNDGSPGTSHLINAATRWGLTYTRGAWPSTIHRCTSMIELAPFR